MQIEVLTFGCDKVVDVYGDDCTTEIEIIRLVIKKDDNDKIISVKEYVSVDGIVFHLAGEPQQPTEEILNEYIMKLQSRCNVYDEYCCMMD